MAVKDIVKGICNITRCKYDVYTKERTDELLEVKANSEEVNATMGTKANSEDVYTKEEATTTFLGKGDVAVLTGNLKIEGDNAVAVASIKLPEGFTKENCLLISIMSEPILNGQGGMYYLNNVQPLFGEVSVNLTGNSTGDYVAVTFYRKGNLNQVETIYYEINYKVVIMKIN